MPHHKLDVTAELAHTFKNSQLPIPSAADMSLYLTIWLGIQDPSSELSSILSALTTTILGIPWLNLT